MDVLAPDVVLLTDGGGVKKAALRPIHGRDKVLRFLEGVSTGRVDRAEVVEVNGAPAVQLWIDGELDTVLTALLDGGVVTELYAVRNPEKLRTFDHQVALER